MIRAMVLFLCLWAGTAGAQSDPAQAARRAATLLEEASVSLQQAESARDRVAALTRTVRGYEEGLAAMRDGLRAVSIREQQLTRQLAGREDEISRLMGVLQSIGSQQNPSMLVHPQGPLGTARSGMLVADVMPALAKRANALRADLEEVTTLRVLQEQAADRLRQGLTGVQDARTALSQAIADRTDLPQRFLENDMQIAVLIASTETLEGFASGLTQVEENDAPDQLPDIAHRKGDLSLPVQGTILRRAGEADAAGVKRPGIVMATRPRALVSTPTAATIRYRGPLLDYGLVMILEPQNDMLIVLAGLDVVYGDPGQVVPEGSPVGLMGGEDPEVGAILSQSSDGTGSDRTETLYIEVRQGSDAVDPLSWFRSDKD